MARTPRRTPSGNPRNSAKRRTGRPAVPGSKPAARTARKPAKPTGGRGRPGKPEPRAARDDTPTVTERSEARPKRGGKPPAAEKRGAKPGRPISPPRKRAGKSRGPEAPSVRWTGFRTMFDYWGQPIKRFYTLDTLAHAVEWSITRKDLFIAPSVRQVLGPVPVTQFAFELFQEGQFQFIFRLKASNARRKEAVFSFVVAKQEDRISKLAKLEHSFLVKLHERAPNHVVRPFQGGFIFLPRHRGKERTIRQVYAYLTQWLAGYHELGVNKDLQFFVNVERPHVFTKEQTEGIKGRIIDVIARTFDPVSGECMEMPQIASGDFVVQKPGKGIPRVKLIACRRLVKRTSPGRVLSRMLQARWRWGRSTFFLSPELAGTVFTGLEAALGRERARAWIDEYCGGVDRKNMPPPPLFALDELRRFGHGG